MTPLREHRKVTDNGLYNDTLIDWEPCAGIGQPHTTTACIQLGLRSYTTLLPCHSGTTGSTPRPARWPAFRSQRAFLFLHLTDRVTFFQWVTLESHCITILPSTSRHPKLCSLICSESRTMPLRWRSVCVVCLIVGSAMWRETFNESGVQPPANQRGRSLDGCEPPQWSYWLKHTWCVGSPWNSLCSNWDWRNTVGQWEQMLLNTTCECWYWSCPWPGDAVAPWLPHWPHWIFPKCVWMT